MRVSKLALAPLGANACCLGYDHSMLGALATILLGLGLAAIGIVWTYSTPVDDANIGAGILALAGAGVVCVGVALLAMSAWISLRR